MLIFVLPILSAVASTIALLVGASGAASVAAMIFAVTSSLAVALFGIVVALAAALTSRHRLRAGD
jgi:hypothetical protein